MNTRKWFALIALPGLCAGMALAQNERPAPVRTENAVAPTRVAVEEYGEPSGYPCSLRIDCNLEDPTGTEIRVGGGVPGATAVLLAATTPANVDIPGVGRLLVGLPAIVGHGVFAHDGSYVMPVDLAQPELIGLDLYMQGWQILDEATFDHTLGLRVRVFAGNEQPSDLTYAGPPLTATLVRFEQAPAVRSHELLVRVVVPSSGYDLTEVFVDPSAARTVVHVRLVEPVGPVMPIIEEKRVVVPVGKELRDRIHLWVEQMVRGGNCIVVTKAAELDPDY